MTIKGSLQFPTVKAFLREILSRQFLFLGKMGSRCKILFSGPPKAHLAQNDVIWRIDRENLCLGCRRKEEPKKTNPVT